jgi:hypothetical protein
VPFYGKVQHGRYWLDLVLDQGQSVAMVLSNQYRLTWIGFGLLSSLQARQWPQVGWWR